MNRLGINSLGELIQRSADELLESKNFGMTSLNEVRESYGNSGCRCGAMYSSFVIRYSLKRNSRERRRSIEQYHPSAH